MSELAPQLPVDESWQPPREPDGYVADAQEMILVDGYTVVGDENPEFGFDPNFRPYVLSNYFGPNGILRPETFNVDPIDRLRARGVVEFEYSADGHTISFRDHPDGTITAKDYHPDERQYEITPLMGDPRFKHYLEHLLNLIPRPLAPTGRLGYYGGQHIMEDFTRFMLTGRSSDIHADTRFTQTGQADHVEEYFREFFRLTKAGTRGIIGVNFFEVFNDVVSDFHQDGVHFAVVDRLEHRGGGAESQLRALGAPAGILSRAHTLAPGQKLIFNDRLREHIATPLTGEGRLARTLVTTVDFETELSDYYLRRMSEAAQTLTDLNHRIPSLQEVIALAA